MRKHRSIAGTLACLLLAMSPAVAGDLAEIEPQLTEKLAAIRSFKGDMTMFAEITQPMKMTQKMSGKVMGLLADGKYYTRQEGQSQREIGAGDNVQKMESKSLMVMDGSVTWSQEEANGQVQVIKSKPRNTPPIGKDYLTRMREEYELSRAADAEVEGAKCWVIDARFKTPPPMPGPKPEKMVLYFRQDDGVMIRTTGVMADGVPLFTMDYSHVELNGPMEPGDFKYEPPAGARVVDRTEPPAAPAPASAAAATTSAPAGGK